MTGGSHAEMPLIQAAKDMGYYVVTTGNNIDGVGHKLADKYIPGDFSDKNFILNLAKKEKVSGIISGCNDFAYLSTAYASEKLGLVGHDNYETAKIIHTKSLFRQKTFELNIKTPKINICNNKDECILNIKKMTFPLLVKPVDLTGGKGVKVCYNEEETLKAYDAAIKVTREKIIILEEFISGSNHGITSLLKNGKIVFYIVDNEQYGKNKYLVLGASSPSDIPQHDVFTLINDIEKIAANLKLTDGLFHTQFILDSDDYPVIIDPCRRAPGDLYVLLAKYTTTVDYPAEIVKSELGLPLAESYNFSHNFVARECVMAEKNGVIKNIYVDDIIKKHIVYEFWNYEKGYLIEDFLRYKAGIIIMKFDCYEKMQEILKNFSELVYIELE